MIGLALLDIKLEPNYAIIRMIVDGVMSFVENEQAEEPGDLQRIRRLRENERIRMHTLLCVVYLALHAQDADEHLPQTQHRA